MSDRERASLPATRVFAVIACLLAACNRPATPRTDTPPAIAPRVLDADISAALSHLESVHRDVPLAVAHLVRACRRTPGGLLASALLHRALSDGRAAVPILEMS
ncbi:MAG: hypothetical protein ABIZ56_00465, partial [Chthoniobacteraceae bacterium]